MSNPTGPLVKNLLLAEVNSRYGLTLTTQDVQFVNVTLVDPDIISYQNTANRNSTLQILHGDMQDGGILINVNYNRLYLPKSFYPYSFVFEDRGEVDISEILPRLSQRLNRTLSISDFENASFISNSETRTAALQAAPSSLVYFGAIEITLIPGSDSGFLTTENDIVLTTESDEPFQVEVQ